MLKQQARVAEKLIGSLSLDLDNAWSYLKTHGDEGWQEFPSYFDTVVPRFLRILDDLNLRITVFTVGQDAALEKNRAALQSITQAGHEIGNHSFHHEPWLHLYTESQLEEEIAKAEDAIYSATGQRPVGFRGPGFSSSDTLLHILCRRQYRFDASSFPTFLGPLARAYYFLTSHLNAAERQQRKQLFGNWKDGLKPLHAFKIQHNEQGLWEIPVTTLPVFRIPIHLSYVLYIALFSPRAAILYFKLALSLCSWFRISPSLLLHPLDVACIQDAPRLRFFPAMRMPLEPKLRLVRQVLSLFAERFHVLPMGQHCSCLEQSVLPF